jgi:hypothetical protein
MTTTDLVLILDETAGSTLNRRAWTIATGLRVGASGAGSYSWRIPQSTIGDIRIGGTQTLHKIMVITRGVHGWQTSVDESDEYFTIEWWGTSAKGEDPPPDISEAPGGNAAGVMVAPGVWFSGAHPTPSGGPVHFSVSLDRDQPVGIELFDGQGRRIQRFADGSAVSAGVHRFTWHGATAAGGRAPAGIYFIQVRAGEKTSSSRIVLMPSN